MDRRRFDWLCDLLGQDDPEVVCLRSAAAVPGMEDAAFGLLEALARERGIDPTHPPAFGMPHDLSPSDYPLGKARCGSMVGQDVGLSKNDLQGGGIGVFGISGTGKTTTVKLLLLSFAGKLHER